MVLRRDCQIGGFRYHFYLGLLVRAVGKFYHVLRCVGNSQLLVCD